jgi:type II secretory pathway component PulF
LKEKHDHVEHVFELHRMTPLAMMIMAMMIAMMIMAMMMAN